jgi:large subunit ribosomal protein L20
MPRSSNSVASHARRKKILKQTKGNFHARANVYTVAKNTLEKGMTYAYNDRKDKKKSYRVSLDPKNQCCCPRLRNDLFSVYRKLAKSNVGLNRKVLADLAMNNPKAFETVIKSLK